MSAVRVRAKDFRPGDRLASGAVVVGVDCFVRGGVAVVVDRDGKRARVTYNGRYVHEVERTDERGALTDVDTGRDD